MRTRSWLRNYPWRLHAVVITPTCLLVAAMFAIHGSEQGVEDFFFAFRHANPRLEKVVEAFCDYGNIPYYLCYVAIFVAGLKRGRKRLVRFVVGYLVSLAATLALVEVFKVCFGRPRPYSDDGYEPFTTDKENHSFPSAHVAETFATVLPLSTRFRYLLLAGVLCLSPFLMALCRMFLGQHHPTDFLGSIVLGSLSPLFARIVSSALPFARRRRAALSEINN